MMGTPSEDRARYLRRKSALWNERSSWFDHWRELSEQFMPRTGRFFVTDRNRGGKRHGKIIDSTGTRASRVLSAGLMAGMTSPARPWFRLATTDPDLMKYQPVKEWLELVSTIMRDVFARSNTYRALHSIYEEIGVYGTGASVVLPDFKDVLRHYPLTTGEYAIATNYRGEVDTLYREFDMTIAQMVDQFGINNVSPSVRSAYETNMGLDSWRTVLHIIEPRMDRDLKAKDAKNMPIKSCYIEAGADNTLGVLRESGFRRFPALVPRWHVAGGDIYGSSPGMDALGDVKQLQHGQLRKGQVIDHNVKPALQMPAALKNHPIATLPGGVMFYDSTGAHNQVKRLFDVEFDMNGTLEDIRDVRQRLNQTFYVDLFLMLAQQDSSQPITAREVAERHEEKLLMLGPVLERLHNELLSPKIDMTFDRMLEAGIVPPPPQEMHGQELNVEFVSVLAQAQRAIGVQGVDRLVQTVGTIATFQANSGQHPDILDKLDTDAIVDAYGDMLGVDPTLIVGNDQVAVVRKQRADAAAQQAKAQALAQAAETAKTASQASTQPGTALGDVISQFSGYGGPGQPYAS